MTDKQDAKANGARPIRKFNPGLLQSDEEVIAQFAVRQNEFGTVSEVLRTNIDAPSCQHVLVVAPRGRGKTMLLARVAAELRGNREFARHLLPVRFMEESQEIYDLAGFWLETLFQLAREIETDHPGFAHELSRTHGALSARWREEGLEGNARAAVLDAADRLGRRLVLMVENLQSLCEAADGDFGWQLRGALQSEPQIMLLATATSRFEALEDAAEPFFELFRIVHLQPLTTEECRRLWTVVGGQDLGRQEIRPLEILTGGNPRLLVVIAAFARHRSFRQLMEELVALIDEHTEYFRSHLESLPKNERRVYVALIDLWQPSSTGEIAARARLDVRVASTMLGRLIDRGAVVAEPVGGGRKRLYAASERLFSIYYKLRRERDDAAVVEALIRFMVVFYDVGEVWRFSDQLLMDALESTAIHAGVDRALERRPSRDDPESRLKWDFVKFMSDKIGDARRMYAMVRRHEDIEAATTAKDWKRVLEVVERYVASGWLDSETEWEREHTWAYLAHTRSKAHLMLGAFDQVIAIGNEVVERFDATRDELLTSSLCAVAFNTAVAHLRLGNIEAARSESRRIVERSAASGAPWLQKEAVAALFSQAEAENELGNFQHAIALLDELLSGYRESESQDVQVQVARSLVLKAELVKGRQGDIGGAAAIYEEAIRRFGHSEHPEIRRDMAKAWINRAFLFGAIGDFDQEIASYDEVIIQSDSSGAEAEKPFALVALGHKSRRLAELGKADEALRTCDDFARRFEGGSEEIPEETRTWLDWHVQGSRALALMARGALGSAMDAFRAAYDTFLPDHEIAMGEMLRLVPELVSAGASERDLVGVLAEDVGKSEALQPMIVALRQRTGETVRAPAEVLQVASDLRTSIEERIAKGIRPGFRLRSGQ
ncbi:MAG: hypothetical protein F4X97_05460 [Boseongicola sp. SB0662_bin_57]|nr:hypothetical protein [Boseongicola sp. SB0662_bin_57]